MGVTEVDSPCELAAPVGDVHCQQLLRDVADEVAQRLYPRPIGDAEVLVTSAVDHDDPVVMCPAGHFRDRGGLADAGFATHEGHPATGLGCRGLNA
jgi:hypothetical protein